jgi:hypothetical protein
VAIDLGGEVPPSIRGKPLTGMAKERWTFLKTLEAWQRHRLVYFNAEGAASGRSVAVLDVVYQGEVTLPLADGTDLVYSPLVVGLRVVEGSIGYGDSGAAWSDVADRLLGMHTVGNAQTGAYSYCQLIDGVMEALQAVLGVRLEGS